MRKPTVDYKNLRLKNLGSPEYNHLLYLLGWVGYFFMYTLTERYIPYDSCRPIHIFLDDLIPFCEVFIVPYVGWYLLIAGSLLWFALYSPKSLKGMMTFIIFCQIVGTVIYIIFPNRQDLRPDLTELGRDNIFIDLVGAIYAVDTSTNVCPSMHVAYSIGIASTWLKEKSASPLAKTLLTAFCVTVCLSVTFVKQHSAADFFAALPMCAAAEFVAFRGYYKEKRKNKT